MGNLVSSLIALAPTLIGPAIKGVEALFGPKNGETKMNTVIAALLPVLEKAADEGNLPGMPDETTLRAVIEALFQSNKASGAGNGEEMSKITSNCIKVPPGAVLTIHFPSENPTI